MATVLAGTVSPEGSGGIVTDGSGTVSADSSEPHVEGLSDAALPELSPDFEDFFRTRFRELVRVVMWAGAGLQEAEDAAMEAVVAVLRRQTEIDNLFGYARTAALTAFVRNRQRGLDRVRRRQVERGAAPAASVEDSGLTALESSQWVDQVLSTLPPAQREVMALIVDGLRPGEVAQVLGLSPAAVRQRAAAATRSLTGRANHGGFGNDAPFTRDAGRRTARPRPCVSGRRGPT
jgi:RNA polymerase sigma-70 factor (ECF subfamily)